MKKIKYLILASLVLIGALYFISNNQKNVALENPLSYVIIDINPSIEFQLDDNDNVTKVVPLNEDARVLVAGIQINGKSIDVVIDEIIEEAVELGFIDEFSAENSVEFIVFDGDLAETDSKLELLTQVAKDNLTEKGILTLISGNMINGELKEFAETNSISFGRTLLIERAASINEKVSMDDLADALIVDIQEKLEAELPEALKTSDQYLEYKQALKNSADYNHTEKIKEIVDTAGYEIENLSDEEINTLINNAKIKLQEEFNSNKDVFEEKNDYDASQQSSKQSSILGD